MEHGSDEDSAEAVDMDAVSMMVLDDAESRSSISDDDLSTAPQWPTIPLVLPEEWGDWGFRQYDTRSPWPFTRCRIDDFTYDRAPLPAFDAAAPASAGMPQSDGSGGEPCIGTGADAAGGDWQPSGGRSVPDDEYRRRCGAEHDRGRTASSASTRSASCDLLFESLPSTAASASGMPRLSLTVMPRAQKSHQQRNSADGVVERGSKERESSERQQARMTGRACVLGFFGFFSFFFPGSIELQSGAVHSFPTS